MYISRTTANYIHWNGHWSAGAFQPFQVVHRVFLAFYSHDTTTSYQFLSGKLQNFILTVPYTRCAKWKSWLTYSLRRLLFGWWLPSKESALLVCALQFCCGLVKWSVMELVHSRVGHSDLDNICSKSYFARFYSHIFQSLFTIISVGMWTVYYSCLE